MRHIGRATMRPGYKEADYLNGGSPPQHFDTKKRYDKTGKGVSEYKRMIDHDFKPKLS